MINVSEVFLAIQFFYRKALQSKELTRMRSKLLGGSHRMNTDRSRKVSISSYRHRSDLVRRGNGSGETTVVEGEQSPVVGLRVVHEVCIDHRGRLPGFSPLTVDVSWFRLTPQRLFLDVRRNSGGLEIS